jgi:molybdate transport system substrate-binding protein
MSKWPYHIAAVLFALTTNLPNVASAEPLKILSAGAFKQVITAITPQFEKDGQTVQIETDTVGGLVKRVESGESFDLVVASPAALESLSKAGKIKAETFNLARVGIGIGVKEGAPKPDISTVEAFKHALLAAKAIAYVNPASGGSSGIYLAGLVDKLGIGQEVRAKSVLVTGGFSAERLVTGEADIAVQQISEILPVKGVVLVGPLPAEIQNYTTYSVGISSNAKQATAAMSLINLLRSKQSGETIASKGMEPLQ